MKLYRWMRAGADGKPLKGERFGMLGVRPKGGPARPDVEARFPTDIVSASLPKGMSVSTDPNMPQSPGDEFLLWEIDTGMLGPDLKHEANPTRTNPGHYLIKPAKDTTLAEYQESLGDTQDDWRLVLPEDES